MKPTALVVSPDVPYPPTDGGRLRVYHLIAQLAASHQIDVLGLSEPAPDPTGTPCDYPSLTQLCRNVDIVPAAMPGRSRLSRLSRTVRCLTQRISPRSDIYANAVIRNRIREALVGRTYNVILLEHAWLAQFIGMLKPFVERRGKMILDLHNIESDLRMEFSGYAHSSARALLERIFARFAVAYEQRWLPKFDHVLTTSDHDKQRMDSILQESGHAIENSRISVIPNGIDIAFYRSIRENGGRRKRLLFCGGLDFPPNRTAIELLVRRVFPQVRREHHDCEIWIVGKDDSHWAKPHAEGVTFTGFVADIRPYIEDATIILAPILNGSGTRFKVLEAWAARRPLIATTKAVEGLNATPKTHFWLADTASDFVDGINQILRAPEQTRHMVDAAYQFVCAHYDARKIGERFRETLASLSPRRERSMS